MLTIKRLLPALLFVAAAVVGLRMYGCYEQKVGALNAIVAARDAAIDSLKARSARRDTLYVRDTLRLTKIRVVTDSLLRTDTLLRVDTVRQIVERERLACDAVVASCQERVALRDATIGNLEKQLTAERGRDRILGVKLPSRTAMLGIGVGLGLLFRR